MTGLREIGTFYDPEEAVIAAGYLHANGFDVIIADFDMLTQNPTHRVALGGFRIMSPEHESADSKKLLDSARAAPNKAGPPCPTCGGQDYRSVKSLLFPAAFLLMMGAVAPFAGNSRYIECRNCKTRILREV